MTAGHGPAARHSPEFVAAWRSVLCEVYRWRRDDRFAVVPSLLGSSVLAYLPGLDYSDLSAAEGRELARELEGRPFNIRALGEPQPASGSRPGEPAVYRVDLAAFGHDRNRVWKQGLAKAARNSVRRARKAGLVASEETGPAAIAAFCTIFRANYHRHGAPIPPEALIRALLKDFCARILVVRRHVDGEPWAGALWLRDGPLFWPAFVGWRLVPEQPGSLLLWALVEQAIDEGADLVDFGRSPTGGGSCRFKRSFGAAPVPVSWLSSGSPHPYRRYALAQRLWRALPTVMTDRLGPRLCRYLADY